MIIEKTEIMRKADVSVRDSGAVGELISISRGTNYILLDKHQAAQLIEVLQRWVDSEEIE